MFDDLTKFKEIKKYCFFTDNENVHLETKWKYCEAFLNSFLDTC